MVYLDYNATTPVLPEILETMLPFFSEQWANPSAPYSFAKTASDAVDRGSTPSSRHLRIKFASIELVIFSISAAIGEDC